MFNLVEKNPKLVKGIMIAVAATFVLWGIGGYLGMTGDDGYVAKVGSNKIYPRDIEQALQQNPPATDKMQILFSLINRQLLINNINDYHLIATKPQLQQEIAKIPVFQESGSFNLQKYQNFLRDRFLSAEQFQNTVQQQILINQLLDFFKGSYFSSTLFNQKFAQLLSWQRNVASYTINPQQFYPKIKLNEQQIKNYYQQNLAKFTHPEQVKLQFIELDTATIANKVQLTEKEINNYLQNHQAQVAGPQIDVSHILFTVPATADAKTRASIKAQAVKVLALAKANPSQFAQLAAKYSEDPGSAQQGGNLGFFGRGVMAKPFEEAAFSLKPGQISKLIETQYGYHILKLNQIKQVNQTAIRDAAIQQLHKQKAALLLQKELEQLNEITYNQPSSLEPAARKLGLSIQTSDWISQGTPSGKFASSKIQQAIFNDEVIKKHNNSEVVDLTNGSYVVCRVIDYTPAKTQTLAEAKPEIINQLTAQQAATLAYQEGQKQITQLQQGKLQLPFTNRQEVNLLAQSEDISPLAVKQIFSVAISKFPAYTGSINAKGAFVIYRINSQSINPELSAQNQKVLQQLDITNAMLDLGAYIGGLRNKYKVSYKIDRLNLPNQS